MAIQRIMTVTAAGVPYRFVRTWKKGECLWSGEVPGKGSVTLPEEEIWILLPAPRSARYHDEGEPDPIPIYTPPKELGVADLFPSRPKRSLFQRLRKRRILLLASAVFLGLWFVISCVRADADCLEAGYPEMQVVPFSFYCIKRVDQTDVVVPLDEVRRQR